MRIGAEPLDTFTIDIHPKGHCFRIVAFPTKEGNLLFETTGMSGTLLYIPKDLREEKGVEPNVLAERVRNIRYCRMERRKNPSTKYDW